MSQTQYPEYEALAPDQREFLDRKLDSLEFSLRTANCLKNQGWIFVRQIVVNTESDMLRVPNFGRKSLNEVKEVFSQVRLHFGMDLAAEVIANGSAAYEAKKTELAAVPAESPISGVSTANMGAKTSNSIKIGNAALNVLQDAQKAGVEIQNSLIVSAITIFATNLESALEHLDRDQALSWHRTLLTFTWDITSQRHQILGSLLYKLWDVVEKKK